MKKLSITKSQEATMSAEAVKQLKQFKIFRLPFIQAPKKMLLTFRSAFAKQEAGELEAMKKRFNPTIEETTLGGIKTYIITPQNIKPENKDKIGLYIHGGGYILGSATDQTGMLMINEMGIKTYSLEYDLAPEAKFPIALNQCFEAYKELIQKYNPQKITAFSVSAGCGHMMGMFLKVREANLPMVNAIGLLSPSIDLSFDGDSYVSNEGRDLLAIKNSADKFYVNPYIGNENPRNPLISPIYGKYDSTFPPIILTTSTRDAFLSNAVRMYWKLRESNVPVELLVSEGMWHAFTVFPDIPEAIQIRKDVQHFLLKNLHKN